MVEGVVMEVLRCPVCCGNGQVDDGFYSGTHMDEYGNLTWSSSSTEPETCRSCDGKGYVVIGEAWN